MSRRSCKIRKTRVKFSSLFFTLKAYNVLLFSTYGINSQNVILHALIRPSIPSILTHSMTKSFLNVFSPWLSAQKRRFEQQKHISLYIVQFPTVASHKKGQFRPETEPTSIFSRNNLQRPPGATTIVFSNNFRYNSSIFAILAERPKKQSLPLGNRDGTQ